MEYSEDFERLHHYFKAEKIDVAAIDSYGKFKQALSVMKKPWDMSEDGKKVFYKYQLVYLKQTGAIETRLPTTELKVSVTGKILFRLPRITKNGQVRSYWTTHEKASEIGYRLKTKKISRKKLFEREYKVANA